VFVLAIAWICAIAFCTGVRMLFRCAPASQVYINVKHFPTLEESMMVEKTQLLI
jgi:hypothetical protein